MSENVKVYTKETAPKAIRIYMDYMADPIWATEKDCEDGDFPCLNSDLDLFPFPPAIMHLLYCFQEAWETAHSSKYISLEELGETFEGNRAFSAAIDISLSALKKGCEDMVEYWFKTNDWPTKLIRE